MSVGGKLYVRYIHQELKPNEVYKLEVYMCLAFLYDVDNYNSTAVFAKNYANLSMIDNMLNNKYKVTVDSSYLTIENVGGSTSSVRLIIMGR